MATRDLVKVSTSTIHGRGVFARRAIPRDVHIGTYDGKATRRNGKYVLWVEDEDGSLSARVGLPPLKYLNHSTTPNAYFDGYELYAARDIEPGEEITFDYGDESGLD